MGEQGVRSDMSSHWNMMDHGALKDHPALKLIDVLAERDAAILERNTALAEKKTANAERDAALLQRDVAYSEWNNVLKERDAAIAALEMIRADRYRHASANAGGNSAAAASKLLQMMNMAVNFPLLDTDCPMPRFGVGPATATPSPLDTKPPPSPLPLKAEKLETETGQKTTPKKRKAVSDELKPPSAKKKKKPPKEAVSQELMMIPKPESNLDVSKVPIPYCSCTGAQQQCYRWGSDGGWQSACCTNYISTYPLPMNPMKRGSRVPGRKMSGGAFKKLLARIAEEGGDITLPLDLKSHWAKHGTNRYITVK